MKEKLGELEQLMLMAVLRRGGTASGLEIANEIEDRTGRVVIPGSIYTIMERLNQSGLVTSFTGDNAPERGGRRRKYYAITSEGEFKLAESYQAIQSMTDGIRKRLNDLAKES